MKTTIHNQSVRKLLIPIVTFFFLISCSDTEEPIGAWDDNIKLSTKNVDLGSGEDSVMITTKGDWWWIDGISFEGTHYMYYHRDDIDLESDSYSITEEGFTVERRDKNTLFVRLDENNTGKERIMSISLQAGNYFDGVTIKQAAN